MSNISQEHLDQIEEMFNNGEFHEIKHVGFGRHSPINLVVFKCVDAINIDYDFNYDEEYTYYAAEIESDLFDFGEDDISFDDFKDDLYQVEKVTVRSYEWVEVK